MITNLKHPTYRNMEQQWSKFRTTFEGGDAFKDRYLYYSDKRELYYDYLERKKISYCSALAKSAVVDIKNSIQHRLSDVVRNIDLDNYNLAIQGKNGGVDRAGSSMNNFLGKYVIQELINMGKVGIYVDNFDFDTLSMAENKIFNPYFYTYRAEDIRSWTYGSHNVLTKLLLRDYKPVYDTDTGLIIDTVAEFKFISLQSDGVLVKVYDSNGAFIYETLLDLPRIPFVILELSQSLLTDIADYQIALTNLASADMLYAFKGNFTFYTESYDPAAEYGSHITKYEEDGIPEPSNDKSISVGPVRGRRYPKGFDRPGFINPSSEPLKVSMEKQFQIAKEIRMVINLSLTNLVPQRASQESKRHDDQGLESGLSVIGSELQYAENQLAEIWAMYLNKETSSSIIYPQKYSLKTPSEKRKEAKELMEFFNITSKTYQKELAKSIVMNTIGDHIQQDKIDKIFDEIDDVNVLMVTTNQLISHLDSGLVGTEYASKLEGYPSSEVEKAKQDHIDRLERIVIAQSKGGGVAAPLKNPKARGVKDLSV